MLSEQKALLRIAELVAAAAVVGSLYLGVKTHLEQDPDFPIVLVSAAAMALLMVTFLPACVLGGEYVKTVRKPTTWRQRSAGLDNKELMAMVRWAPRLQLWVAALGLLVLIVAAIQYGNVRFSSDQAADPAKVPGLFFYFCFFYSLSLPVLGSASRMPGSYANHGDA